MKREPVVALIPSNEQPPRYVIDSKTKLPPTIERAEGRTAESMLIDIGRQALSGHTLRVDYAVGTVYGHSFTPERAWVYLTKSVPPEAIQEPDYRWGELPSGPRPRGCVPVQNLL